MEADPVERSITTAARELEITANLQVLQTWQQEVIAHTIPDPTLQAAIQAECGRVVATARGTSDAVWCGLDIADIYGSFQPHPDVWRIAPHHFPQDHVNTTDAELTTQQNRNEQICRANKRALHIWIDDAIPELFPHPHNQRHYRDKCFAILRTQQPGNDPISMDLHFVYDLVNRRAVQPPRTIDEDRTRETNVSLNSDSDSDSDPFA